MAQPKERAVLDGGGVGGVLSSRGGGWGEGGTIAVRPALLAGLKKNPLIFIMKKNQLEFYS
jgi:hypothetical protein